MGEYVFEALNKCVEDDDDDKGGGKLEFAIDKEELCAEGEFTESPLLFDGAFPWTLIDTEPFRWEVSPALKFETLGEDETLL